ncbi:MAG: PQQ-dependent sugar dehydrogenase [Sulfolobales archaeon]
MRRRDFIRVFLIAIAGFGSAYLAYRLAISLPGSPRSSGQGSTSTLRSSKLGDLIEVEVVATDLEVPWSIAPVGYGEYFISERPGRILYLSRGGKRLVASFDVASVGEAGLLGLAVHPEYPSKPYLYAYLSYWSSGSIFNRIIRGRVEMDSGKPRLSSLVTILDKIPGGYIHNGGRLRFGPDQKLYATTGDASRPELAQDLGSLAGKILRLEDNGEIPRDNPFYPSPIYSYGHRNPQGIDWSPLQGFMIASEHGPVGHDEINLIKPGSNYGWPEEVGRGGRYNQPIIESGSTTWAPSGISFLRGNMFREFQGDLLVACLRGEKILRISLHNEGEAELSEELLVNSFGRLRDVVVDFDGSLLVSTSNRDGRGFVREGDDKILRIIRKPHG